MTSGAQDIGDFRGTERFEVRRRLGAGAFGVVYEAHDRERRATVALKTLVQVDPAALYRFKQEFRALADVIHPNLVALHELVSEGDVWFFTMELVQGVSFLEHIRADKGFACADTMMDRPPVPARTGTSGRVAEPGGGGDAGAGAGAGAGILNLGRLRSSLRQLAEGVAALHAAGKLHRDLKPPNVLVTDEGRVVILDFGLVAELETSRPGASTDETGLVGTAAYMAPEQAAAQPLSEASDWYSVGAMLYEALTGRVPHLGTFMQVLVNKQKFDPPPPRSFEPTVPDDLNRLCLELLSRNPLARPTGREVLRRLGAGPADGEGGGLRPPTPSGAMSAALSLVGRERHLSGLREAFEATLKGRAVTVYVHGPSGMGKSALARHFVDELARRDEAVALIGRCYERESVPYKAFDTLIDALSRHLMKLPRLECEALLPRDVLTLARLFPVLRRVEAVAEAPRRAAESPDPQELRRRAFSALRELLARLADRRPLVLFIDDLQWGDVDSAALLHDLLRPPDPPALLLVGCYRSEDAETSPVLRALLRPRAAACELREVVVGPLGPAEARELALELLGEDGDGGGGVADGAQVAQVDTWRSDEALRAAARARTTPELRAFVDEGADGGGADAGAGALEAVADAIAKESQGNPLFVDELVQYVRSAAGAAILDSGSGITLAEVLRARFKRLPPPALRLLETVAVAGRPLAQAVAFQASGLGPEERGAVPVLRAGHLIRTRGTRDDDEVECYHDRIRETAAGDLAADVLRDHHKRLAFALGAWGRADPEALAVHHAGAGDGERAGEFATAAAEKAAEALAFDRAARLYRFALEQRRLEPQAARALRTKLGDALANAGRGAEAALVYLEAAAGAAAAEALELKRRAAENLLRSGHIDRGLEAIRAVLDALGMGLAKTPLRALLSFLFRRAQLRLRGLRFKERDASQVAAEELARIDVCWSVATGLGVVDTIRGADFQTRHLLLGLRAGEPYRISRALAMEAGYSATAGGPQRERTAWIVEEAMALARRVGHPHALGLSTSMTGIAAFLEGRWKAARRLCDEAESILRERCTGAVWEIASARLFGVLSLFYLGEIVEMTARVRTQLDDAEQRGDLFGATNLSLGLSNAVWLAAADPEGATHELDDIMERWSQQGFHVQHYHELQARTQIDLYRGEGLKAHARVTGRWPALKASLLLRIQYIDIFMVHLRARAALGAAAEGAADLEALLRAASKDARHLEKQAMPWSDPLAAALRAGVAARRGDREGAAARLAAAVAGFEATDMMLFAAAARRRRGELLGGDEGRALVAAADAWFAEQQVVEPVRMAAMLVPGI